MRLEDMRLFAEVARAGSFTAAARRLGMPKQTVSRRVGELEQALATPLLHRTTRRLTLTAAGAAYAERCAEIVRLADEANRAVTDTAGVPRGLLRVTADPVFGDAFVGALVLELAARWPDVQLEVVLTRRHVDLIDERFDVAFRIGHVDHPSLTVTPLGPARVRYCASPGYVARRGAPSTPAALPAHDCIVVASEGAPARWPFRDARDGLALVPVAARLRTSSFAMAHAAALRGLGVAIFPEFACARDVQRGRLVTVLDDWLVDVGAVCLVHPTQRYLAPRVRAFLELVRARFAAAPPWVVAEPITRRARRGERRSARSGARATRRRR
jgi:molybdate transport repressor ModE-like protein